MKDSQQWWDEFKKDFGLGKLSEIRAELDDLLENGEVDWNSDFASVRVYDVAHDAAHFEAGKYKGSKSFAASYMLLNGLYEERFRELYRKTYRMSGVSAMIRLIVATKKLDGIDLREGTMSYELSGGFSKKNKYLRIYTPLYVFTSNLAEDMEIETGYLISVLILSGSSESAYRELFERGMEKMYVSQIVNYNRMLAMARAIAEVYGSDDVREMVSRVITGAKSSGKKKRWELKGISAEAIEMVRKVAKLKKMRLAEVVEDAVFSQYGWVLDL